ncbi:MAG: PLP-dependent aminotransferase family protein [Burkholderiaceae bacterium]|nr:PLP-dependent aminotransferase family protein [Burkholderiaceae bacterium]
MGQLRKSETVRPGTPGAGRRLYEMLRRQLNDGTLSAGEVVPSTRVLAAEHGVSRTTVTAVYDQLVAEGFIETSAGRVARVASQLASAPVPPSGRRVRSSPPLSIFGRRVEGMVLPTLPSGEPCPIDFLYGAVASHDFPALQWRRAYQAALLLHQHRLYYEPPEGDASLRRALQGYLARARGLSCDDEQIVIVHGSQQAIDLCARLLLEPGDAFAFEDPGYLMARRCFEATGASMLPVAVDEHGLDTALLPDDERTRLVYTTPSHQFPMGAILPIGRRQDLMLWAKRRRAWIIEDDYDGEFRYGQRPIDALQAIDGDGRVIYVGTFSKVLSPQLRLGYLVLPSRLVPVFRQAKRLTDRHAPVLEQRALAALIDSGAYERHVRRVRRENARRRAALLDAVAEHLPTQQVAGDAAGLHVVLWLPAIAQRDEAAVVTAARERGVGVYPLSPLFAGPELRKRSLRAGLILGYASLTVEQIQKGIASLAAAIAHLQHAPSRD